MTKIYRNITFVLSFVLFLALSLPVPAQAETEVEDQFCENSNIENAEGYWFIKTHSPLAQTFTPTKNRLTEILLAVEGGDDITAPITMELSLVGGEVLISQIKNTTTPAAQWLTYSFDPIILDTTKQYKITVTSTSNTADWIVSTVPCYAGGTAFVENTAMSDQDFGFVTRGYNITPPAPTPVVIAKPTTLTAEYLGQTEGVKVDWSASSTVDITGYNIYRSESETASFTKLDSVSKAVTEYTDHGIVESITYYYQVRAYKGDTQSVASPTASVEIPSFVIEEEEPVLDSDIVTTQEEDDGQVTETKSKFIESISNYLIGGAFILLAIIAIVIFLATRKKSPKAVKPEIKTDMVTTPPARVEPIKVEKKEGESVAEVKVDTK